jgi:hypothetical protein
MENNVSDCLLKISLVVLVKLSEVISLVFLSIMNIIFDIGTHLEVIQVREQFFPNCISQNSGIL